MANRTLRVLNNCAIGGCASMDVQKVCPECPHWTPSRGSKYRNCDQWWSQKVICDLPREHCELCPNYIPNIRVLPTGRPNETGIDWNDPEQVRMYYAERKSAQRKRDAARRKKGAQKDEGHG